MAYVDRTKDYEDDVVQNQLGPRYEVFVILLLFAESSYAFYSSGVPCVLEPWYYRALVL